MLHSGDSKAVLKLRQAGTQIAAGVPFKIGESEDTTTFRIGLFGLDKLSDPPMTASLLRSALECAQLGNQHRKVVA